ncbi:GNAT family N-acetyltransferase [Enterococcus sp. LJL99]
MIQFREAKEMDYIDLIKIWRDSVSETHLFLSAEDIDRIEKELPHYFEAVKVFIWFESNVPNEIIGFSGIHNQKLEMLFLKPTSFRKGYGKTILNWLVENEAIEFTDVNKQNSDAVAFYLAQGFKIISESPTDEQGNPFPILHLRK